MLPKQHRLLSPADPDGASPGGSAARARRLRAEVDKLEAYCVVVHAAATATDQKTFAQVSRSAAKALRDKFGGGSVTSAFAWVAGRAGQAALASVQSGEVKLAGPLSLEQIVEAAALARETDLLRRKAEGEA